LTISERIYLAANADDPVEQLPSWQLARDL